MYTFECQPEDTRLSSCEGLLCCTAGAAGQTFNKALEFLKNVTIFNQFVFIPTVTPPALLLGK